MTEHTSKKQLDLPEIASASLSEPAERLESLRRALVDQVCDQLQELSTEVFDKIDDSLFVKSLSAKGEENGSFWRAVREIRNKKVLFEETLLDSLRVELESNFYQSNLAEASDLDSSESESVIEPELESESSKEVEPGVFESKESVFEQMEIELALQRMQRRATKHYVQLTQQLNGITDGQLRFGSSTSLDDEDHFLGLVGGALNQSRAVFNIPLDIKLIFLKHFELSFLMEMEMVYVGLINVLKNQSDVDFVDQFCSSVELNRKSGPATGRVVRVSVQSEEVIENNETISETVRQSAEEVATDLCDEKRLPPFVEKMIKEDWRDVMLLIGLNQGVDSAQWKEAKQVASRLLDFLNDPKANDSDENIPDEIKHPLKQGFDLIQLSKSEQDRFFRKFDDHTIIPNEAQTVLDSNLSSSGISQGEKSEVNAAISEAGRKILDDDDLDDIVALLSGEQDQKKQEEKDDADDSLSGYLNLIDKLREDDEIEYVSDGNAQKCKIQKSVTADNSFQVTNRAGKVLLARSRVGLALSAKAGEIRLGGNSTIRPQSAVDQRAVLHTQTKIDPPTTH